MLLFIGVSGCTRGAHLSRFLLTQPRMLCLHHRLTLSAAPRRKRQSKPASPLSSAGLGTSVAPCRPLGALPLLFAPSPSGRARTLALAPVAFASSSAASAPAPSESGKQQEGQTPTAVPLEDVKRILKLAHPERWTLAGKQPGCRSVDWPVGAVRI